MEEVEQEGGYLLAADAALLSGENTSCRARMSRLWPRRGTTLEPRPPESVFPIVVTPRGVKLCRPAEIVRELLP